MHTKTVNTEELIALDLRPIIDYRVQHLKDSISTRGYDPACPLIVQPNHQGYFVVNGNLTKAPRAEHNRSAGY